MKRFEYKTLDFYSDEFLGEEEEFDFDKIDDYLRDMGEQGWELIAVTAVSSTIIIYTFKREINI